MRSPTLALLLLGSLVSSARAANPARPRFHIASERFVSRLSPGARKNAAAVVAFPRATGFVVGRDPANAKRILILTNYHVAGEGPPAGDVVFSDGTTARSVRTIANNPNLDYAVVEAELQSGPRAAGVEPLALERAPHPMQPGDRTYALGGHTGLGFADLPRSVAGGHAVVASVEKQIADAKAIDPTAKVGFRTIALGQVKADSKAPIWISTGPGKSALGVLSEMPNSGGMSGSPVFSRATHKVVGLHFAGGGADPAQWEQSSVPIDLVLQDLRAALATNNVTPAGRDLVQRLVDGN